MPLLVFIIVFVVRIIDWLRKPKPYVPYSRMTERERERFREKYDIGGDFWLQRRKYAESVLAKRLRGEDVDPYLYKTCLKVMDEPRPQVGEPRRKHGRGRRAQRGNRQRAVDSD